MDLAMDRWRGSTARERANLATRLAGHLPSGFALDAIERHRLGEAENEVASFRFGSSRFALVPGGPVALGFAGRATWEPNADERQSWRDSAEEYGFEGTIRDYVATATRPPTTVELAPFLIEATATAVRWEPSPPHPERAPSPTHAAWTDHLGRSGFRLPTSDEWEYACGAGNSALFRWGDHAPCDRYPIDHAADMARWGRVVPTWEFHRDRNAFGLAMPSDPYQSELVAEADQSRGGDGGSTICGGAGFFLGWLTLATAYFEDYCCRHDPTESLSSGCTVARRVFNLG